MFSDTNLLYPEAKCNYHYIIRKNASGPLESTQTIQLDLIKTKGLTAFFCDFTFSRKRPLSHKISKFLKHVQGGFKLKSLRKQTPQMWSS